MRRAPASLFCAAALIIAAPALAHDGPPFPLVSDRQAGSYTVSIWTDPDTTDDGTPGGQFWVMIAPRGGSGALAPDTRATVSASPAAGSGVEHSATAVPVRGDAATQFAALLLDREGVFRVRVAIQGAGGPAVIESQVTATYNLRPPPAMVAVYLVPFILVGGLWTMLLVRRRRGASAEGYRRQSASARHQ